VQVMIFVGGGNVLKWFRSVHSLHCKSLVFTAHEYGRWNEQFVGLGFQVNLQDRLVE
jgi:hypothetical protein